MDAAVRTRRLSETRLIASLDWIARLRKWIDSRRTPVDEEAARAIVGAPEHQRLLQAVLTAAGVLR